MPRDGMRLGLTRQLQCSTYTRFTQCQQTTPYVPRYCHYSKFVKSKIDYQAVPGFFLQDHPAAIAAQIGAVSIISSSLSSKNTNSSNFYCYYTFDCGTSGSPKLPNRFGLIDSSTERWDRFKIKIDQLNAQGARTGETYKVFFLGRHGQGWRE